MKTQIRLLLCVMLLVENAAAQTMDSTFPKKKLDYSSFIAQVGKNNLGYASEKFNLSIAEANIIRAGIFPDPEFTVELFDNSESSKQLGRGYTAGLSWMVELGAKRRARRRVASDEAETTRLLLVDYFRNLRADATLAFLSARYNQQLVATYRRAYQQLSQLAASDSIRYQLGVIPQIDYRQSKLEAAHMQNTLSAAEATANSAIVGLALLMGDTSTVRWQTQESDVSLARNFLLPSLLSTALQQRSDLRASLQNKQLSQSLLQLAKANRVLDLGISIGFTYNGEARNETAPTPQFNAINAGLAIPLKFSNFNKGEIKSLQFKIQQDELAYKEAELHIQTEVNQAYMQYKATQKQVQQFNNTMLLEAKAILEGKIYSYNRGETALLEVINAQRSYNETQLAYDEARYNYAVALVELQRAAAIWDIDQL
ncbi:TolC family protein [Sphingobacterium sp. DR205]|uniref:TolC family protein n=1 Tax=Sphingobacterium sp. DR205 TaxID=2713573 RepID=UPI0013E43573|nr:TolC family protein [Sphingobacterium sp. DR205]QIH32566.1 TolC family protein [Sphingobacterium sp. DR205]